MKLKNTAAGFSDPVSQMIMSNPTKVPCGHTLERESIHQLLQLQKDENTGEYYECKCPLCKVNIVIINPTEELTPNTTMKKSIQRFLQSNPTYYTDLYVELSLSNQFYDALKNDVKAIHTLLTQHPELAFQNLPEENKSVIEHVFNNNIDSPITAAFLTAFQNTLPILLSWKDLKNKTAMHYICQNTLTNAFAFCMEHLKPDEYTGVLMTPDGNSRHCLHLAFASNAPFCKTLIDALGDQKVTAIKELTIPKHFNDLCGQGAHIAVKYLIQLVNPKVIHRLLNQKNIALPSGNYQNLLHLACSIQNSELLKILLPHFEDVFSELSATFDNSNNALLFGMRYLDSNGIQFLFSLLEEHLDGKNVFTLLIDGGGNNIFNHLSLNPNGGPAALLALEQILVKKLSVTTLEVFRLYSTSLKHYQLQLQQAQAQAQFDQHVRRDVQPLANIMAPPNPATQLNLSIAHLRQHHQPYNPGLFAQPEALEPKPKKTKLEPKP